MFICKKSVFRIIIPSVQADFFCVKRNLLLNPRSGSPPLQSFLMQELHFNLFFTLSMSYNIYLIIDSTADMIKVNNLE